MTKPEEDIGAETLRRMRALDEYNRWIMRMIAPWLGETILEVGSGIGNMSRYFLDRPRLILSDVNEGYLDSLRASYGPRTNVAVERFDLEGSGSHLAGRGIDTVVALNVLEHIRDDRHALGEIAAILAPGGHAIFQLPAHRLLMGSLDHHLDHYRRYTIPDIRDKFREAGLVPVAFRRMNAAGAVGWFVCSRILRRTILPEGSLGLFNLLTPLFYAIERVMPLTFGLSLIAVGRKESQ